MQAHLHGVFEPVRRDVGSAKSANSELGHPYRVNVMSVRVESDEAGLIAVDVVQVGDAEVLVPRVSGLASSSGAAVVRASVSVEMGRINELVGSKERVAQEASRRESRTSMTEIVSATSQQTASRMNVRETIHRQTIPVDALNDDEDVAVTLGENTVACGICSAVPVMRVPVCSPVWVCENNNISPCRKRLHADVPSKIDRRTSLYKSAPATRLLPA